ncbi:MAG: hypothetical protein ACTHU0_09740 [Kofleriaceae bacterium]
MSRTGAGAVALCRWLVVLLALAACGRPPRWSPPESARFVAIVDDLVVRGEVDGQISVMARVALDDRVAFGVVRLRRGELATAAKSPHVAVARARAWQTLSHLLAATPDRAYEAAQRGRMEIPGCAKRDIGDELAESLRNDPEQLVEAVRWKRAALVRHLECYVRVHHEEMW